MYTRDTEIRHLTSADLHSIAIILDQTDSWKKLVRVIPKDLTASTTETTGKYNNDHVQLIEIASIKQKRMSTAILFEEWGTSGRKRPTLGNLLELLVKSELFRAADHVAKNLLKEQPPPRPLKGPAARIDISLPLDSDEVKDVENILDNMNYPDSSTIQRNAEVGTNLNNQDFYEKIGPNRNKVNVNVSDMMKFSSRSHSSFNRREVNGDITDMMKFSKSDTENMPHLSSLLAAPSCSYKNNNLADKNENHLSNALPHDESTLPKLSIIGNCNIVSESLSNIPMISVLHGESNNLPSHTEHLPNLSVLNIGTTANIINTESSIAESDHDIPNLSALNIRTTANEINTESSIAESDHDIPNLSALNIGTTENGSTSESDIIQYDHGIPNLSILNGQESTIEDDNNFQPNLSILGNSVNSISSPVNESSANEIQNTQQSEEYIPLFSVIQK